MNENEAESKIELTEEQLNTGREKLRSFLKKIKLNSLGKGTDNITEEAFNSLYNDELLISLLASGKDEDALNRMSKLLANKGVTPIFAMAAMDDGSMQPVTGLTLIDLLERGLDEERPDAEAADKLKQLLGSMLQYAETQQDILSNPIAVMTLDALREIYNYLQSGIESIEELDKFFKGQKEFMAIPRPAGIEDLLRISAGIGTKEVTIKSFNGTKITFSGRLAIDEQKICEMIRIAFAQNNPYRAKTGLNTLVVLPFSDTMKILGRTQTTRNRKAFSQQLRHEMLPNIASVHLEIKDRDGGSLYIQMGGGTSYPDPRNDKIYFRLNPDYAAYLNSGAFSQYSNKTLTLGTQRNPLPFYLAIKLQDQYFHDGNRNRKGTYGNPQPTNNILSIKTLLEFCSDNIPSYEDVQQTDRGHWVRLIRQPLEAALNEIQTAGLFSWEYCKKGLTEATPQEIRTNDFNKWSNLYITFRLIPDEPNQTERLEHKQERLEAAQAKQALKDAQTIIQADKIEKRKARRKKQSSES